MIMISHDHARKEACIFVPYGDSIFPMGNINGRMAIDGFKEMPIFLPSGSFVGFNTAKSLIIGRHANQLISFHAAGPGIIPFAMIMISYLRQERRYQLAATSRVTKYHQAMMIHEIENLYHHGCCTV